MNPDSSVSKLPRPRFTPPAVLHARFKRAMDIECAFFKKEYPPPLLVIPLGASVFALDCFARKTVACKIVRLDR